MFIAIVPAYNEAKKIASVVTGLLPCVDEVVVIDDGSIDDTASLAEGAGATVLRHSLNRGQGAALETGHEYARSRRADFILHFDGDGQFDPEQISGALNALRASGADLLLGSRFLGSSSSLPWFKRYVILPLGKLVDRAFGKISLTDAHNGFRILNNRALDKIRITQDRMAHATEIPAFIKSNGLRYIEHPVSVSYDSYGQGAVDGAVIVRDLVLGKFVKSLSQK